MRIRMFGVIASSLFLFACGGSTQKVAAAPEPDPWAGYQGTFAGPIGQPSHTVGSSVRSEPAKEEEPAMTPDPTASAPPKASEPKAPTPRAAEPKRGSSKKAAKKATAKR